MSTSASFNNSYFVPIQGKAGEDWVMRKLPMIASVAMSAGGAVYNVGDGTTTVITDATTNFAGILMQDIAATDADYATSMKEKYVMVPTSDAAKAEFAVGAGTFTTADVGKSVKFNDYLGLAVDTAGIQARITNYISSTRGVCIFNRDIV